MGPRSRCLISLQFLRDADPCILRENDGIVDLLVPIGTCAAGRYKVCDLSEILSGQPTWACIERVGPVPERARLEYRPDWLKRAHDRGRVALRGNAEVMDGGR